MGRGRAKAKQTKVARDLKYRSVGFDSASLERELRGESLILLFLIIMMGSIQKTKPMC